ncbi:MAG TPA: penicillin-binding protein 2 [Oculatellaceae cyanobacterium]|jgi:cell division protein FtsI (penicillin-binding protein 3)
MASSEGWKRNRRKSGSKIEELREDPHSTRGSIKSVLLLSPVRLLLVWAVLILTTLGLGINLYRLQIVSSPVLLKKARQQQMVSLRPFVPRRSVVDRNGNFLATDQPSYTLYAHPKLFKVSKQEVANQLSKIINVPEDELLKKFNQKNSGIRIAQSLREDLANHISRLNNDGLELIGQYSRLYPQQELAADVVGYVDSSHRGQAGVEYSQFKLLERAVHTVRISRSGNGEMMPDYMPEGFLHYDDLQLKLTIDNRLQRAARLALKEKIKKFNAKRGAVLVMNAQDGSLLAMVSEPTYNPNEYSKFDMGLFKNWALADLYEPGSTFKPINVAIALEAGAITPDTTFNDSGHITVAGWPIKNAQSKSYGLLNITQILQYSSNIGMVQMMQKLNPEVYYSWLEKLGLGNKVGIDLPFESQGQMKSKQQFMSSPIEPATTSFGQGFSLTPIQLVTLHASLANGGKIVTPHVVRGLFDSQGQMYWQPNLPAPRPVFSPQTSDTVLEMMEKVVSNGTGKPAQIPGYRIGGKTGTAQKASASGGYDSSAKITSFVGILPVDASKRYVVLAVVDNPQGNVFGSTVAAPIVKSVMEAIISIEGIPPSQQQQTMPGQTEQIMPSQTQIPQD